MGRLVKDRRTDGIRIAFMVCIFTAVVVGFLGSKGFVEKKLSELVFIWGWILGINLWHTGAIIKGEVHWREGPVIVSRARNPIGFWCFICFTFTLFNGFGLLFLLSRD